MFCKKCGSEIKENDKFCKKCGERQTFEIETVKKYKEEIKNYLGLSIASVLFCVPFGVIGLIASTDVERNIKKGKIEQAKKSSQKAKKYSLIGIFMGIPFTIIYIALEIYMEIRKCN
jgi:uncharacterized membrane protein YvbJ